MYEDRLIHIVGQLSIGEPLTEPDYGIQVSAVKLKRRVQMYQWVEETMEYNYGESVASVQSDEKTYYYTMEWRDKLIDSRNFYIKSGHTNPTSFPIQSRMQIAEQVHIGEIELSIYEIPFHSKSNILFQFFFSGDTVKDRMNNFLDITSDSRPEDTDVKLHSGLYYHCNDIWNPEIGDIRIQFSFAGFENEFYTIVGKYEKGKVVPYETSFKTQVLLVYSGELTLIEAFRAEHHSQKVTTWGFRFFGWLLLFFAATCTATLLNFVFSKSQLLSSFAPDPNNPVFTNLLLSFSFSLFITSIAWIIHRPYLGGSLLFAAISPFLYCARSVIQYQRIL